MGKTTIAHMYPIAAVLIIVVLTLLLIPAFPVQIPYKAEESYSRPIAFEVLSVSWKRPSLGLIIFEIIIHAHDGDFFQVIPKLWNVEGISEYHNETYQLEGHIPPGGEKTFGAILEYVPIDAEVRMEYSVEPANPIRWEMREVTKYRTVQRSIIGMLPPAFYALLTGGIPAMIALTAAWLPLFRKPVVRIGEERLLRIATVVGVIILLISVPLSWVDMFLGEKLQNSWSFSTYLLNLPGTIEGLRVFLAQGFPTVALGLAVALATYPSAILAGIVGEVYRKRKWLFLCSLFSGILCIASATSWIYAIEIAKAEPIWSPYSVETGIGPFLGTIAGALILFSYRLSTKVGCTKNKR